MKWIINEPLRPDSYDRHGAKHILHIYLKSDILVFLLRHFQVSTTLSKHGRGFQCGLPALRNRRD